LPKPKILLCGPVPSRMPPEQALEMLQASGIPGAKLTLLTAAKFDAQKAAKTFNIEANYAAEPLELQTMSAWSGTGASADERLADGLEVFALCALDERDGPFDYVLLQRSPAKLGEGWAAHLEQVAGRGFVPLGAGNFLFRNAAGSGARFTDALWDLYASGALYARDNYSFELALSIAADALRLNG
jgi:hypothetical protein